MSIEEAGTFRKGVCYINLFEEVYRLLDKHPMALVDCGELCGKICCCYKFPGETEFGVELIPGEEQVFPLDDPWHQYRRLTGEIYDYPPEWGEDSGCIQVRCTEPCPREQRPLNCRLFPFRVILVGERYYLGLTGSESGYSCPLADRAELVNPEFIRCAIQAVRLLLEVTKFQELIQWDSGEIDLNKIKAVIPV